MKRAAAFLADMWNAIAHDPVLVAMFVVVVVVAVLR